MKTKKLLLIMALVLFIPLGLYANKTSVEVVVPETAEIGETVTITIKVSHRGNSSRHFTDWVFLKIGGEEVKKWEYSRTDLPEDQSFTIEYEFEIESTVEIEAQGNCNIHGSSGAVKKTIDVN